MESRSKETVVLLANISDEKFQLSGPGVEYPFTEFWFEVDKDRPAEDGRVFLKIVDPPE